ncbi:hypothetical protein BH11PLA2_BH11PLA2_02360 [soil metagenome]
MATEPLSTVELKVRKARRRLIAQKLLNNTALGVSIGLGIGLAWFLAEPWLLDAPPEYLRWAVAGTLAVLGAIVAVTFTILRAPTRSAAAHELDNRFNLKERVTTVLGLPVEDRNTSAGQAVLNDAIAKVSPITVSEKFTVRPTRTSLMVPTLAAAFALAFFFYQPDTSGVLKADEGDTAKKSEQAKKAAEAKAKPVVPFSKPKNPDQPERGTKSKELKDLENELDKLMEKWAKDPAETEEKKKEKVTELTAMEEKLKKFEQEKAQKLEQMESKLNKLDKLNHDRDFADGPAKEFNESLSKGDLKKALEDVDELKKKAKDKKLDKEDLAKLDKQLDKMRDETEKLARNKEQEQKVKEKLDKAKQEGRDKDAESLQRELEKMQNENKQSGEQMEKMAEQIKKMQQAIKNGNLDELAESLEAMKGEMQKIADELEDINEADDVLQRLKDELGKACKACKGKCPGDGEPKESEGAEWDNIGRVGAGRRDENKNAITASSEERIKGLFDPKGKKSYGGSTRGPSFTKRSSVEMGQDIQSAVQEASRGLDAQGIPRDAKNAVKEYMEKIGGNK